MTDIEYDDLDGTCRATCDCDWTGRWHQDDASGMRAAGQDADGHDEQHQDGQR